MDSERTVATVLAGYLRQAGVTRVFGYPGESVVEFMEAARDGGPAIIAAVREASAAFMAEGAAIISRPRIQAVIRISTWMVLSAKSQQALARAL